MKVKRIVANIAADDAAAAKRFYHDVLGLDLLMDLGWIATYGSGQQQSVQVSIASEGGSGTPVPDLSIEVDDIDAAMRLASRGTVMRLWVRHRVRSFVRFRGVPLKDRDWFAD